MIGVRPQLGQDAYGQDIMGLMIEDGQASAWDDVTNKILDPEIVRQAWMVELEDFRKLKIYTHVLRSQQGSTGEKIIGVRWVDVNNGDDEREELQESPGRKIVQDKHRRRLVRPDTTLGSTQVHSERRSDLEECQRRSNVFATGHGQQRGTSAFLNALRARRVH